MKQRRNVEMKKELCCKRQISLYQLMGTLVTTNVVISLQKHPILGKCCCVYEKNVETTSNMH